MATMQQFATGATRSSDEGKNDYEGYLSMSVIEEYGDYMTRHRVQADGQLRDSDNWQKGMPLTGYMKSLLRHVLELVGLQRGFTSKRLVREYGADTPRDFLVRETACAILFNIQGFLHEYLKLGGPEPAPVTSGNITPFPGLGQWTPTPTDFTTPLPHRAPLRADRPAGNVGDYKDSRGAQRAA